MLNFKTLKTMEKFKKAEKSNCKIKMALQGSSGSGKSYSALLIAYGLTNDWSKVAVIDTENGSAHLYSDLGNYSVLNLSAPYTPEAYSEAIDAAVKNGFECLIIDSLSHEWNGSGGILDIHSNIPGNSFTAWAKVTPRHTAFVQKILESNIHIIGTMRSKTDYVLSEKDGKMRPEKIGLKAVQREDAEYEFTLVFEINQKHFATVSKDRTGLFKNKPELVLTAEVGKTIAAWCNTAEVKKDALFPTTEEKPIPKLDKFEEEINSCKTADELLKLFNNNPDGQSKHLGAFLNKRNELSVKPNYLQNGVHH